MPGLELDLLADATDGLRSQLSSSLPTIYTSFIIINYKL